MVEEIRPVVKAQVQGMKADGTFEDVKTNDAGALLVHDSVEELLHGRIFYDATRGVPGTTWPIGTPGLPSNTIADVVTMLAARNLKAIDVHGAVTFAVDLSHKDFFGNYHESLADILTLAAGNDVDDSHFYGLIVTGAQGGTVFTTYKECLLLNLTGFRGMAVRCTIYGTLAVAVGATGISDFDYCTSIHGVITVTIGNPNRVSFKEFSGGMILTAQTAGAVLVRGISGYLEVDAMNGGAATLDIYAHGADIQINADCIAGTINIYGDARVTGVGGGVTINNYTLQGGQLHSIDFWSNPVEEVVVTAAQVTTVLSSVVVADLPAGAVVVRAIAMFKFRMVENTNAAENSLDCTAVQPIQVDDGVATGYLTAIDFVDELFKIAATTREGGDVLIGDNNIAARVDGNDTYPVRWLDRIAHLANIQSNDVQFGIRIWYSL